MLEKTGLASPLSTGIARLLIRRLHEERSFFSVQLDLQKQFYASPDGPVIA